MAKKNRKRQRADRVGNSANAPKAKADTRKRWTVVAAVVLAVLMVASVLLPSFSAIFSSGSSSSDESADAATESATTAATASMTTVDDEYGTLVKQLKAKLEDDPDNLAALLNLGNDYMSWGSAASSYATDDQGKSHVSDLFDQAIAYYDKYLKLNDSNDVHVKRALCQYYAGDTDEATKALEDFTSGDGKDYGPAWAYLGVLYQYSGDTDKAQNAYKKAVEVDAVDADGAKSLANQQLAAIKASENSSSSSSLESILSDAATSSDD